MNKDNPYDFDIDIDFLKKKLIKSEQKKLEDFFMDKFNAIKRLEDEYIAHGKIIIAYDFDDTIYDFHKKGRTYPKVMQLLRDMKEYAYFICFTCCGEEKHEFIKQYLKDNKIPCDSINKNMPNLPFGNNCKVYYNILLDDRAGLESSYYYLNTLSKNIKDGRFDKIMQEHEDYNK